MTNFTRRQFLAKSLNATAGITGAASLGLHMGLSSRVLAQSSSRFPDYKALVCVFLYGGNDSFNLLVPTDTSEYNTYQSVRQNLAYSRESLLPLSPLTSQPYSFGMPAVATSLHNLFNSQKLSIVANMGPLSQPLTKAMILNDNGLVPPQLFSHNDQQSLWQSATMNTRALSGWGGRMADLIADTNDSLSMNMSIFGSNLMQSGTSIQPFAVDSSGPETFVALDASKDWNRERVTVFDQILDDSNHPLSIAYANKMASADLNNQRIQAALDTVSDTSVNYPETDLAGQLEMVAKLIASQPMLGQQRQIFFVGMGGWDTHDAQSTLHPQLLASLGDALASFQQDIDNRQLQEQITTFTLSEFGRTLTSNGDGTDHGWGGHQMVMGGAIKGGDVFGTLPELALNSSDDLQDGRMIPTVSVDQYGGALAQWFGLTDNELNAVFPNLSRFDASALNLFNS